MADLEGVKNRIQNIQTCVMGAKFTGHGEEPWVVLAGMMVNALEELVQVIEEHIDHDG